MLHHVKSIASGASGRRSRSPHSRQGISSKERSLARAQHPEGEIQRDHLRLWITLAEAAPGGPLAASRMRRGASFT
jgi:hypothetical protein